MNSNCTSSFCCFFCSTRLLPTIYKLTETGNHHTTEDEAIDGNGWKFSSPLSSIHSQLTIIFISSADEIIIRNSPWTPNFGLPNSRWNWLTRSTSIFISLVWVDFLVLLLIRWVLTRTSAFVVERRLGILHCQRDQDFLCSSSSLRTDAAVARHTLCIYLDIHTNWLLGFSGFVSAAACFLLLAFFFLRRYEDFVGNFLVL